MLAAIIFDLSVPFGSSTVSSFIFHFVGHGLSSNYINTYITLQHVVITMHHLPPRSFYSNREDLYIFS